MLPIDLHIMEEYTDVEIMFLPFLASVLFAVHMARFTSSSICFSILVSRYTFDGKTQNVLEVAVKQIVTSLSKTELRMSSTQSITLLSYQGFRHRNISRRSQLICTQFIWLFSCVCNKLQPGPALKVSLSLKFNNYFLCSDQLFVFSRFRFVSRMSSFRTWA